MKRLRYILGFVIAVSAIGYVVFMLAIEGYDTAAWIIATGVIYAAGYWQRLCDIWTRQYSRYSCVSESPYWKASALIRSLVWFLHPFQMFTWVCGKRHCVRQTTKIVSQPLA